MTLDGATEPTGGSAPPPEGWVKQACDDGCGRAYSLVVTDVDQREVDLVCWPCLAQRAVKVMQALVEADAEGSTAQPTG